MEICKLINTWQRDSKMPRSNISILPGKVLEAMYNKTISLSQLYLEKPVCVFYQNIHI